MADLNPILKAMIKRFLALILVLFIIFPLFPNIGVHSTRMSASAATTVGSENNKTWINGKLTYSWTAVSNGTKANGAAGTVTPNGTTLTVTATNSKYVAASGCDPEVPAQSTTTTVTVTNASSYPLKITSLSAATAAVSGVKQGDTIASGATFTITLTASAQNTSTTVSDTVTIAVEEQTDVTITLAASPYVSYTVNGTAVAQSGSDQTFSTDVGTSISLPAITAPDGYEFKGWRVGGDLITGNSFTANGAYTVFPVIVTGGTDVTAANFKVGSKTYTFWEDAIAAAVSGGGVVIVNLEDVVLPSNVLDNLLPAVGGTYVKPSGSGVEYVVPAGVTLQLPYNTTATLHTTTPAYSTAAHVVPSAFRTLTVPDGVKITVNGAVSVDSLVSANGQNASSWNGTPSGPHGKIVMKTGSEMTFNSGANLYCYGYINGDGDIYVNSGAKVYELFQFRCWRGGTATKNIAGNSNRIFPMNQYYIQNVEAPMTLYKGATEYVWSVVNMSSSAYPTSQIEFIGTNGMFKLTGSNTDHVTKRYHANVDRLEIEVDGNMTLNALNVKITGLPLIGTIDVQSSAYVLPINNMEITLHSGTTSVATSQKYGVAFLPGSKLTVDNQATFSVNTPVYFYDADDWDKYGAGDAKIVAVGYSTANGSTNIRTADNLEDAELDVNGTVTVSDKLYTTASGAHITSSSGTGQIKFTAAPATASGTTYQYTQSGTDCTSHSITVNNAWLLNGDGSYTYTVGTGVGNWYYDKEGEHWYRYLVDFVYDGSVIARDYYCEKDDTVTYDASWLANLDASATSGSATVEIIGTDVNVTSVTANTTVTLAGVAAEYKPTFVLNEHQYGIYQLYTGGTLAETTAINGETYYVVRQAAAAAVGAACDAPSDASMGVTAANHNGITWNMSGISATSGDPFKGVVPVGQAAGGPAYIYGFYSGYVAYNSYTDSYYTTLIGAFEVLPQDVSATITLLADCGTFEDESGTIAYTAYEANNITLDLNGYHALGRIVNSGTFTLELNGGVFDYHTGVTAAATTYRTLAAVINSGTLTIKDTPGGGKISSDAISNDSGANGSAVIRNNAGATLSVTGQANDNLSVSNLQNVNGNNYGIFNLGTITALTNVDISTATSGTCGINLYNYDTGVVDLISGGHMFCYSNCSIFNYGGTIAKISGLTIDGKNGITNRNLRTGALATGYIVTDANTGTITTIENSTIEVGQYAIFNHAKIGTLSNSTFIAHPDSAQVDIRGNGLSTASEGNTQCYTVYNSNQWWYNSNLWKQVDSTSGGYTRVNYYKEEEAYRPSIGTITDCEIYAENTGSGASYGYALTNYGVIEKIGGTTNIKTYKHPNNANSSFSTSHYALHNLSGGIIKSIEGAVNVSATGVGTVYNDGVFTTQINYTYGDKVNGNETHRIETYGQPSTIRSITASGTWSCGSYYALMNSGYIGTINAPGLTLSGNTSSYNVLYNATGGANSKFEYEHSYTDVTTASTEYQRIATYTKNLEKGSTIGTINGITVIGKYNVLNNQGHIGTLSNVTASNNTASNDTTVLNGDSRYKTVKEIRTTNVTSEDKPNLTVSAGTVTTYDREYTYDAPTIDVIDNLTVTSNGQYALRNAGVIGTLKNSTITATTSYALHNSASGPYTERQTLQYYSGAGIFKTDKNAGELNKHYKRNPATITLIDNCTIKTNTSTYAALNVGHIGTIKNSAFQAGATTAAANALANINSQEREYTRNLEEVLYVTANAATSCTAYYGCNGESNVVTYDYDAPSIDLIGEGNTFTATTTVISNIGIINEINSGAGTLTAITSSAAKSSAIYNSGACLDARTTTTPYTAATEANKSGTAGTAVNSDTLLPGAQIGTIKNVYINANGYGILNGDGKTGKLPTIGEIGEGTEIYANCATALYHAIYNQTYAEITRITGGVYTVTKATTNAYRNNYASAEHATTLSGGDFKGMAATRDNAIYDLANAARYIYPNGKMLSTGTESVTLYNGTKADCYFITSTYTVTFDKQGHGAEVAAQTLESGKKATKPADLTEDGWIFGGWFKEASCETEWDFASNTVTSNTTLFAKWTEDVPVTYIVTFVNDDGTVLQTGEVTAGDMPAYTGDTPTKAASTQYTYTFSGWTPEVTNVEGEATYTATYTAAKRKYTVNFINDDGTVLQTGQIEYGAMPSYTGDTPTKSADAQYTYAFADWTPEVVAVTGNATYTATYAAAVNKYTVTWENEDGTVLETDLDVAYGTVPSYDGATPTNGDSSHAFIGWSSEIVPVTGDVTYTAQYHRYFTRHSLTLDGSIGVNFYLSLPSDNPEHYTVDLTFWTEKENILGVSLSGMDTGVPNEYKVSFPVDAAEMTDCITATLYYDGYPVMTDTFHAAAYAKVAENSGALSFSSYDSGLEEGGFYLIGKINGLAGWGAPNAMYRFKDNPLNDTEYMLSDVALKAGDEFKVIGYHANGTYDWYPNGENNNYVVSLDGTYNIYIKKTAEDVNSDEWHHKKFYVQSVDVTKKAYSNALLPELVRAMLHYGAMAQTYFEHNDADLADGTAYLSSQGVYTDVTDDMITAKVGEALDTDAYEDIFSGHGLTYYGNSLLLNSNTKMRFYFTVDDKATFNIDSCGSYTLTMPDGEQEQITPVYGNKSKTLVYFEISGIEAANLDYRYTLSDGTNSIAYSALDYVRLCLGGGDSLEDVCQALFWYNHYADLYFGAIKNIAA